MPLSQRERTPRNANSEGGLSEAFTRLYDTYFDAIYWYCRNRLADTATAEDAASTIFTRALSAGPRYEDPALRSWLFTIAHNVVINTYRAHRPLASLEDAWAIPDPARPLEDAVVADDERHRLLTALERLPPDQRQVVELRMAGLTGLEIARVMERSHGAVKMLQLRAFTQLRVLLVEATREEGHGDA